MPNSILGKQTTLFYPRRINLCQLVMEAEDITLRETGKNERRYFYIGAVKRGNEPFPTATNPIHRLQYDYRRQLGHLEWKERQ